MILTLIIQHNYNGTVTIAEPCPTRYFQYIEVCTANDVETAKNKAKEIYNDYKIIFMNEDGE